MPKSGAHRALPRAVKQARGTLQKCRDNPHSPPGVLVPVPDPPKDLRPEEREMWLELKPQVDSLKIYTTSNESAYRMLVCAMAMVRHPELCAPSAWPKFWTTSLQLIIRFGLDPASRDRVSVVAPEKKADAKVPLFGVVNGGAS